MCFAATAKPIVKNMAHELHAVQQNRRTSKFRQYHGIIFSQGVKLRSTASTGATVSVTPRRFLSDKVSIAAHAALKSKEGPPDRLHPFD
jgi:hypothetical protein